MAHLIQSFEEACERLGIEASLPDVSNIPERFREGTTAAYKLMVITEAQNEGHVFDWNDYDELKYQPYFDLETYGDAPAGSDFSFVACVCDCTFSRVGSRLALRSAEEARHMGTHFIDLYRALR